MYMTNEEWEQNNQDYLKESYEKTGFTIGGCKGKQAVQTLRRNALDSGKCANGVQKVCSRFPT